MVARRQGTLLYEQHESQETRGMKAARRGRTAFEQLLQAVKQSERMQRDVWDFALEDWVLHKLGLTNHDLCWLTRKGFLAYGYELPPSDEGRNFHRSTKATFSAGACFVPTDSGIAFMRQVLAASLDERS